MEVKISKKKRLAHKSAKGSTGKWFLAFAIPFLNLYWFWKAAEVVSGHEKVMYEEHGRVKHLDRKDPTAKLLPIFLAYGVLQAFESVQRILNVWPNLEPILTIATFVGLIYVVYIMADSVSGHETIHSEEQKTVGHKDMKDSTGKWIVFGIIPILNFYFFWKMSETISGHEETRREITKRGR
ncbi:hypothetical protein AKJ61_01710 [candidate division MSBL1 archaeon SCGC-AAA259B11]|uniref:DUF4234 domain-containing protein n=1 Tax=candidate division MSBL1 archaeon SCGC-AAA259B11 TaxID=1698260 RepID=A0A133U723_9EURY|nr:hypothetical protein AKJ61_01710 [candidate division MSBL1 archaeon SCGC-AAA259B11]